MKPIIVSAYIDLNKKSCDVKSISDYLKYSLPLINLDHPKIIFLEPKVISLITNYHPSTLFVPFSKDNLFFNLHNLRLPVNANPNKDTHEYFAIQLNKTDWILKAHELFPNEKQFIWVDFGISHVCNNPNFVSLLKEYNNIRIAGCLNPNNFINDRISTDNPNWVFCGGLFGGHIYKLIIFDFLVKNYTNSMIKNGMITWEVNIWFEIYKDYPELFDWYYSDHDCGMINNY